jgi:hypothetical protein
MNPLLLTERLGGGGELGGGPPGENLDDSSSDPPGENLDDSSSDPPGENPGNPPGENLGDPSCELASSSS